MTIKDITIGQWVAFALIILGVVAEIISICKDPWAAIFGGAMFVGGMVGGYLLKKKNIVKE